jgi:hypothetical protein
MQIPNAVTAGGVGSVTSMHRLPRDDRAMQAVHRVGDRRATKGHNMQFLHTRPSA